MAANTTPIFARRGNIGWNTTAITAANTTKDGSSGTIYPLFTADATEGSFVQRIVVQPMGTNVQTVMRVWINDGGATTTAANNTYFGQQTLSATTNSEVAALISTEIPMNIVLPAGYTIFVTIGTAVAAGFNVTVVGGDY